MRSLAEEEVHSVSPSPEGRTPSHTCSRERSYGFRERGRERERKGGRERGREGEEEREGEREGGREGERD